jgi:hypothetical protein
VIDTFLKDGIAWNIDVQAGKGLVMSRPVNDNLVRVPTPLASAELRCNDLSLENQDLRIRLRALAERYRNCRHGVRGCNCEDEARAALDRLNEWEARHRV